MESAFEKLRFSRRDVRQFNKKENEGKNWKEERRTPDLHFSFSIAG